MSNCRMMESSTSEALARDPVCGTLVDVAGDTPSLDYLGRTYFFRTPECRAKFEAGPSPYIAELAAGRFRVWVWAGI